MHFLLVLGVLLLTGQRVHHLHEIVYTVLVLIDKVDWFCRDMEANFLSLCLIFIDFRRIGECDTDFAFAHEALLAFLLDFLCEIDGLIVTFWSLNR